MLKMLPDVDEHQLAVGEAAAKLEGGAEGRHILRAPLLLMGAGLEREQQQVAQTVLPQGDGIDWRYPRAGAMGGGSSQPSATQSAGIQNTV